MTKEKPAGQSSSSSSDERRQARRRPIIATFALFIVVPKKGMYKLQVHDLSEGGIAFDFDIEGESPTDFPVQTGDVIDVKFYINQSLFIPLTIQVIRISDNHPNRRIGAQFQNKSSPNNKALLDLLHLLDSMTEVLQIDPKT